MTALAGAPAPTTPAAVRERVAEAVAAREPLRIAGAGTWLDAGRPVRAARVLSLDALRGVVDYTPGDLVLTARAGTSLDEIARVTAAERQWLTLDPPGDALGTLGATIATASAGPLAHAFGTPRDNVLGLEAVTGTGDLVHTGGRVVKNVAGFDLTRLFTGAWGTLAVITAATVRLRALPEVDETHAVAVDDAPAALDALLARLRAAPVAPLALELLSTGLAARLGVGRGAALLVRLGGNAAAVRAQRAALGALAPATVAPPTVWGALRAIEPAGTIVARHSAAPGELPALWRGAIDAVVVLPGALARATVGRGIVRVIAPPAQPEAVARWLVAARDVPGRLTIERLPADAWAAARVPGAAGDTLSRRVRRTFDPAGILNPGVLGDRPGEEMEHAEGSA